MDRELSGVTGGSGAVERPRNARPRGWSDHVYTRTWAVDADRGAVWSWLNDPATFTRQVWPFRVEFVDGSGVDGGGGFSAGVLNAHHGPLLMAAGVLTEIDGGEDGCGRSRTLAYFYGSKVISFRLVRPTVLRFDLADRADGGSAVTVRLESYVNPWFAGVWGLGLRCFWGLFPGSMRRGARKRSRPAGGE